MAGFHVGGYRAALEALNEEHEASLADLLQKLKQLEPNEKIKRDSMLREIAHRKQEHLDALMALQRSLY